MKSVQIKSIDDSRSTIVARKGFSLIELMIVISLFAIITIAATISYISFEGSQRLKNGALQIKSDLRQAQINAQSGDKGAGSCDAAGKLIGWYLIFDTASTNNTLYKFAMVCQRATGGSPAYSNTKYSETTMNLPTGVSISTIEKNISGTITTLYSTASSGSVSALFKPLDYRVVFFGTTPAPPVFTDTTTGLMSTGVTMDELIITLYSADGTYKVKINSSGQISESKT